MIIRIKTVEVCGPWLLALSFSDGTQKTVDVRPLLVGPVLTPLFNKDVFSKVELDTICGTVVWPNGADLAPEALYALAEVEQMTPI